LVVAMALGALATGLDEVCIGLLHFDGRAFGVDDECRNHQGHANDQGNKDRAETHEAFVVEFIRLSIAELLAGRFGWRARLSKNPACHPASGCYALRPFL
jgi:hypothetical protein